MSKKSNSKNPIKNLPFIIAWTIPVLLWILFYFFLETTTDRGGNEFIATSDRLKFLLLPIVYWTYVILVVRFYNSSLNLRKYILKGCATSIISIIVGFIILLGLGSLYEPLALIGIFVLVLIPILISRKYRLMQPLNSNTLNESIKTNGEKYKNRI